MHGTPQKLGDFGRDIFTCGGQGVAGRNINRCHLGQLSF
jgi:hypothetical protein